MSAQTDTQFLEKDEFYLALRLIALAQNNLEVSEESIRLNHPVPPLPRIDMKSHQNPSHPSPNMNSFDNPLNMSMASNINKSQLVEKDEFSISEEDDNKYTILFNKNKDNPDKISLNKLNEMFVAAKIPSDTLRKIFDIVKISEPKVLNISEFKVVFHLIYKSYVIKDVPANLPNSLRYILSLETKPKGADVDFMGSMSLKGNPQQILSNFFINFLF